MLEGGGERVRPRLPGAVARTMTAAGRLVLPVLGLIGAFALAYAACGEPASDLRFLDKIDPALDVAGWLNWGHLLLPGVFFVLNLTSRRYGPGIALASAVIAWVAMGGGIAWALSDGILPSFGEIAPLPVAVSFAGAMFTGQLVSVYLFDWLRGIPWWQAPLVAAFFGGLAFVGAFHAGASSFWAGGAWAGGGEAMLPRLALLGAVQLVWALLQLVPTQFLRGAIRPASGYGGA